jgi:nucleotide-binding universal stress UspA family protein
MQRIVVGYDGSDCANRALEKAALLATSLSARLTVLTAATDRLVRSDGVLTPAADEAHGREVAEAGAALARQLGVGQVEVQLSLEAPDDALVLASETNDLVVVGHCGHNPIQEFFVGSTAKSVVDRVHGAVLVVR